MIQSHAREDNIEEVRLVDSEATATGGSVAGGGEHELFPLLSCEVALEDIDATV